MSNCGLPDGVVHAHSAICFQGGRRDALAEVRDTAKLTAAEWATLWAAGVTHVQRPFIEAILAARSTGVPSCPTCGPTPTEQHPRRPDVTRCSNCKEWLRAHSPTRTGDAQ